MSHCQLYSFLAGNKHELFTRIKNLVSNSVFLAEALTIMNLQTLQQFLSLKSCKNFATVGPLVTEFGGRLSPWWVTSLWY